jgi:hypothetical protein
MDGQAPHDQPPQNGGQQLQPNMMMMYGQPPQGDQGGGEPPQQNPTDPSQQQQQQQQQQQAYASYPGMAFPPPQMQFFAQPYPQQPGMEQVPYGNFAPQYAQPGQGDPSQQDYMNTNQYLLARLQQTPWMTAGYGMPMTEGYAMPADAMMMGPWSATSAGLLGKIGGQEPKKKSVRKKHKDKPKRPLSAYNLFFKDERKNILESVSKTQEEPQEGDDEEEQGGDGKKKTKTPQGKIGFENLAKIIGQRWQKLEPDRIEHYKKLAAIDMKRYKAAMEVFLAKIENEKKKKYETEEGEEQYKEDGEEDDESGKPAVKKETEEEEIETKQV